MGSVVVKGRQVDRSCCLSMLVNVLWVDFWGRVGKLSLLIDGPMVVLFGSPAVLSLPGAYG